MAGMKSTEYIGGVGEKHGKEFLSCGGSGSKGGSELPLSSGSVVGSRASLSAGNLSEFSSSVYLM